MAFDMQDRAESPLATIGAAPTSRPEPAVMPDREQHAGVRQAANISAASLRRSASGFSQTPVCPPRRPRSPGPCAANAGRQQHGVNRGVGEHGVQAACRREAMRRAKALGADDVDSTRG